MKYYGISAYQFYTTLKHVDKGIAPEFTHGNFNREHLSAKTDLYIAWLGQICAELAESLPTGFKLKLAKRVFLTSYFEKKFNF
jgi:hypothetical protein